MGLGAICFELTLYPTLTHCASDTRWPSCLPSVCDQNRHFEITYKPPSHHWRPYSPAQWSWSQFKISFLVLQIGARPGFPPREVKTTFFLVVSPLQQGLQFVQLVTLHFKAIEGLIRKLTWQSTTINDLTSGWWGHPIASMCRPLLDRSFNRDIAGPENTDSFEILKQKFLIANMTIPENTVTTSALVVEGSAGRFLQARTFAVL